MSQSYSPAEIQKAHQVLYSEGLKMRQQVAGKEYVAASLSASNNPFSSAMQEYVSESCWGSIWTRGILPLKTRSFLNIVMLCSQNRSTELATHVKGAMNNGASEEEVREVLLQAACYCGMPAGIEGFRVAWKAIQEWNESEQGKRVIAQRDGGGKQEKDDEQRHEDLDLGARTRGDDV